MRGVVSGELLGCEWARELKELFTTLHLNIFSAYCLLPTAFKLKSNSHSKIVSFRIRIKPTSGNCR